MCSSGEMLLYKRLMVVLVPQRSLHQTYTRQYEQVNKRQNQHYSQILLKSKSNNATFKRKRSSWNKFFWPVWFFFLHCSPPTSSSKRSHVFLDSKRFRPLLFGGKERIRHGPESVLTRPSPGWWGTGSSDQLMTRNEWLLFHRLLLRRSFQDNLGWIKYALLPSHFSDRNSKCVIV